MGRIVFSTQNDLPNLGDALFEVSELTYNEELGTLILSLTYTEDGIAKCFRYKKFLKTKTGEYNTAACTEVFGILCAVIDNPGLRMEEAFRKSVIESIRGRRFIATVCITDTENGMRYWNLRNARKYTENVKPMVRLVGGENKHKRLCEELNRAYEEKNREWGEMFHNTYKREGMAARILLGDKMSRFEKLTRAEGDAENKSIRGTLMDLANYALMTVMELDSSDDTKQEDWV